MKGRTLGSIFVILTAIIVLILGMILGYRIKDDIEENGLCWAPSISTNGEVQEYEFCLIQPPEVDEDGS